MSLSVWLVLKNMLSPIVNVIDPTPAPSPLPARNLTGPSGQPPPSATTFESRDGTFIAVLLVILFLILCCCGVAVWLLWFRKKKEQKEGEGEGKTVENGTGTTGTTAGGATETATETGTVQRSAIVA
ncbi:unnamed protein product [Caenorhabditis sp. 36 PRJEB53466]|nr:unnamed protein product [Caenorhabditis sp. 36 PRJEB53466]